MSEVKRSEIVYEEGWRDAAPPDREETPVDEEKPADETAVRPPRDGKPLLLTIQLGLCLIFALVLFLLKTMDSPAYHRFMAYYRAQQQKPLISQEVFGAADIGGLFSEPSVKVEATPDETADRRN